tara:strand:+ start:164 stop:1225 length:1062 start_codon:yes stop_codon:yes gene_type:complete
MQTSIENKPDPNKLLDWYDYNAREMPWRIAPKERVSGIRPNPYHVWLSEIMLQQTTVASVKPYFTKFTTKWPTIFDLANAKDEEVMGAWAGLGYYARARNLLKCARLIAIEKSGEFPQAFDALLKLPGIGPYTASAIASIAYDIPETVVDGNVERVISRIFNIHTELPKAKKELSFLAKQLTPKMRSGDYAQAIMDLGATICKPKIPNCEICPWVNHCISKKAGTSKYLPRKVKKTKKPIRYGIAYFVERADGAILTEIREPNGLLGGMLSLPSSEWGDFFRDDPPIDGDWEIKNNLVKHTFTHFDLNLKVMHVNVAREQTPKRGKFLNPDEFDPNNLPTVMKKVWKSIKYSN